MPTFNNLLPLPKKDLNIFYVLDTSAEKSDFKDLRNVLLYMRREFGLEVFRNPARMASIINDLSPTLRRDANILRHLGERGLLRELEQADNNDRTRVTFKVRHWLESEFFMREEQAAYYAQALELLYQGNLSTFPKMDTLNHLVKDTIRILDSEAKKRNDRKLQIAALEFNANCRWITYGLEDLEEEFIFEDMDFGGTESNLGAALRELNSELSRSLFSHSIKDNIIIFMTDGHATDDYMEALKEIRNNKWFRWATKIGFTLSDKADVETIASVIGNEMTSVPENKAAVFQPEDMNKFKELLSEYSDYRCRDIMPNIGKAETFVYYDKYGEIHIYAYYHDDYYHYHDDYYHYDISFDGLGADNDDEW